MTANPGRCGWHDLERVWNADEQRWMCPHYSQDAKAEQESRAIEASEERENLRWSRRVWGRS